MPIKVGDRLPNATFRVMTAEGPKPKTTDEIFKGKKVVLFAVPGAFTPTCHKNHLPGFVKNAAAIKAKGIDTIAVTAVNDAFVMDAWKKASDAEGKIEFLSDGNAEFAKALGLELDVSGTASARAPSAIRCWSRTAWSSRSTSRTRPARPTSPAPIICSSSFKPAHRLSAPFAPARTAIAASRASWSARSFIVVAGMALDPVPAHLVARERRVEALPQVDILDRLLVGGAPAVPLPALDPAGDAARAHTGCRYGDRRRTGCFSASSAAIAAISSMRLLVVCASPPFSSFSRVAEDAGSRPSRRGRDCPSRRRRCRSPPVDRSRKRFPGFDAVVAHAGRRLVKAQLAEIFQRVSSASPARRAAR